VTQLHETLVVRTRGRGLHDITEAARDAVRRSGIRDGGLTLFILHTSASLLVHENADPSVKRDLESFLSRLCPDGDGYEHDAEGPDDMPSHLRAAILSTSLALAVEGGRLRLGTWQGISVYEHRLRGHERKVALHAWA
jgi:secondary thiamine-phosphate synthase enzyme